MSHSSPPIHAIYSPFDRQPKRQPPNPQHEPSSPCYDSNSAYDLERKPGSRCEYSNPAYNFQWPSVRALLLPAFSAD